MNEIEENLKLCTSTVQSERVAAYTIITRKLSSQHQSVSWGKTVSSENVKKIVQNVKVDLFCKEASIVYDTTGFFGCFLDNERLMDCLSVEEEQETFDTLIKLLTTCDDKTILNRSLWCFAQSKFGCDIYSKNICQILAVIKNIMEEEQTSTTRYEALQVIKSLLESSPSDMKEKIDEWFSIVFNSFFHAVVRVRGIAYSCMLICKNMHNDYEVLYSKLLPLLPDLKDKHCKTMSTLIDEDCIYILKIWRLLVTLLGKYLHPGTGLINRLLEVLEKAFKSSRPECRVEAFKCWQILITNFALDPKVINHPKRMKLLLAPFKLNNAKSEETANAKLSCWWHFVVSLGERCSEQFDMVVVPLLKYCFYTTGTATPGFERNFVMAASTSPARKYPALHIRSIEILASLFNTTATRETENYSFSVQELKHRVILPSVFLRNYQLIFSCVGDALQILNIACPKHESLGLLILNLVAQVVNETLLVDYHKKECVEMVKDLLSTTVALENTADSVTTNSFLLAFMNVFVLGELALPSNVMNSRQYNVPVGTKPQEMVIGTLNNFFISKLLKPSLLIHKSTEIYKKLWDEILRKSNPSCGKFSFFESTLEELNGAAPLLCPDSVDIFVGLWMQTCSHLHDCIQQENSIDQGDGSDYDWRCMYKYILFPIRNSNDYLSGIESTPTLQNIINVLNKLWSTFTSHCSLTPTAEPNCECDFICKELISLLNDRFTGPPDAIAFTLMLMTELLHIIIKAFRFKDLGRKSAKAIQSPARPKKKPHVLHNLGSCIDLLCLVMEKANRIVSSSRGKVVAKVAATTIFVCKNIPKKYAWHFISSLCDVLRKAISINPSAKYTPDVESIFVDMWTEYTVCVQTNIGKNISGDQLSRISPLLIAGLSSSHHVLKEKTRALWTNNFASTKFPIPTMLYDTLKVSGLPPASISDALTESQDTFYKSPEMKPGRNVAKVNLSPVTPGQTTTKSKTSPLAKKATPKSTRKSIFDMKDEDFVKVSSPSLNKRLLTPHQAEKMKSRGRDIPALYSDLSQSMSQLPPGFTTQDSVDPSSSENCSRSKELFPPLDKKKKESDMNEDNFIETVLSPAAKKESPSKSYSDEDLNEILKDTSLELEKSLIEIEKSASVLKQSKAEEKENRLDRKRKLDTPTKKSIDDVRKSLKGTKFTEQQPKAKEKAKAKESPVKVQNVAENRRQPLKDVAKSPKSAGIPTKSTKEVIPDSDEEIPCSQIEGNSASKSLISKIGIESPCRQDRPKRNKRKYLDDGYEYTTPTKRFKETPKKDAESPTKTNKSSKSVETKTPEKVVPMETENTKRTAPADTKSNGKRASDISSSATTTNSVAGRKSRGRPRAPKDTEVQKLKHDNFDFEPNLLGSPTKVTRSGRRIVVPKKEMPEPITPTAQKIEVVHKSSPRKLTSPAKKSPVKSLPSPLASPISSAEKVISVEKCNAKLQDEMAEPKGQNVSIRPNRKLFDDNPKTQSPKNVAAMVSEITELPQSPLKSPNAKRRALEIPKRSARISPVKQCAGIQKSTEIPSTQPAVNGIKNGDLDAEITHKRKRSDTEKLKSTKSKKINKKSSVQISSQPDCRSDEQNENDEIMEDQNLSNNGVKPVQSDELSSEKITILKNTEEACKKQSVTEDENMNMVKESTENTVVDEQSPKFTGQTSFSGLINKLNSPKNKSEILQENAIKTATVVWSPSSKAHSPQTKEEGRDKYFGENNEDSPVRKTQMRVLGQSASCVDSTTSPVKNLSPPCKLASLRSRSATIINNLDTELQTVRENGGGPQKKQESPLRMTHSGLSNSISTPEIHHMRKAKVHHSSRAAAMLARAQQAMKNKANDAPESPISGRILKGSKPSSNSNSPLVGRKTGELSVNGGSPWARFQPSPNASPGSGILKRKRLLDEDSVLTDSDLETSPCVVKNRRVSFADPVFESIEIPPSPKAIMRAQKKLDLNKWLTLSPSIEKEAMSLKEAHKELSNDRVLDSSHSICPELTCCKKSVDELIYQLAEPGMTEGLSNILKTSSVITVGDIAQLTESELHMFPVLSPKTERTVECLRKFATKTLCNSDSKCAEETATDVCQLEELPGKASTIDIQQTTKEHNSLAVDNGRHISDASDEDLLEAIHSRLENNSNLAKQLCDKMPDSRRQDIFESLLSYLPYSRVIDIYSDFLKKKVTL